MFRLDLTLSSFQLQYPPQQAPGPSATRSHWKEKKLTAAENKGEIWIRLHWNHFSDETLLYSKVNKTDGGKTAEVRGGREWKKKEILERAKGIYFKGGCSKPDHQQKRIRMADCDFTVHVGEGMDKRELTDQEDTCLRDMPRMTDGVFVKLSLHSKKRTNLGGTWCNVM